MGPSSFLCGSSHDAEGYGQRFAVDLHFDLSTLKKIGIFNLGISQNKCPEQKEPPQNYCSSRGFIAIRG